MSFVATESAYETPTEFRLDQNYPNPFNPSTRIRFQLPVASNVRLVVFDALGREVALLVNGSLPAGTHEYSFDAHGLSSGAYIYQFGTSDLVLSRSMLLLK